jgi:hypothetical protein
MGNGYIRADTSNNIADGGVINASDLDGEFDALVAAFSAASGHTHDGTGAEGAPILVLGPAQEYVGAAGNFSPKTDDTYDLGKVGTEWKDLHLDGVANIDDLQVTTGTATALTITTLTTELDTIVSTADLPITLGGTGGGTISAARTNLELEALTQAEAEAGTKTTGAMNPLRTAQAIAALSIDPVYEEFLTSGTWTKPAGVTFVYVEAIGAGGGGANNTTNEDTGGASGGEFVSTIFQASALSATETVTIGASGAGAANGAVADGSTGGNSSFGSLLTAIGGNPGVLNDRYALIPRSGNAFESGSSGTFLRAIVSPQAGYGDARGLTQGGNTIYGGGGGGGGRFGSESVGGTSEFGGDGGDGTTLADTKGGDGSTPGGGGGGSDNDGGGGDGGAGRIRVWAW